MYIYENMYDAQANEQDLDAHNCKVPYDYECSSNYAMEELYQSKGIMLAGCF